MIQQVCVFASSSDHVAAVYKTAARRLGDLLSERGCTVVYGAGNIGLMGAIGDAVLRGKGRLVGIIPEKLHALNLADENAHEIVVTPDMRSRKAAMEARSEAFIALPGGFGTLEEILEILVLRQLWYHRKPVIFLNVNGIYDGLMAFFERLIAEEFIHDGHRNLYYVADTPEDAVAYLESFTPDEPHGAWF